MSVPWSRLNPRRKYWLALPSPECCVTVRPGTSSSTSPGRVTGRLLICAPVITPELADSTVGVMPPTPMLPPT